MAWVIFGLGAALCLSGAAALWSGVSYMPVEWGWSQIIAGATALAGGVVTIALAVVVQRLGALQALWLSGLQPSPAPAGNAAVYPVTRDAPAPLLAAAGRPVQPAEPRAAAAQMPASSQAEPAVPISPLGRQNDPATVDGVSSSSASQARRVGIGDIGELDPSRDPADPDGAEPPAPVPGPASERPPEGAGGEQRTVVGRYEAGGASYALYSDGTIEVESESGTHHFASMSELKAFLERQDNATQSSWPE